MPLLHIDSLHNKTPQDPLVHHRCHFGRVVHAFCSVQILLTNGIVMKGELGERELETFSEL
jgi:hypothetical protein